MIVSLSGFFGDAISLDLRQRCGERVELECFHFVVPPPEFRLLRSATVRKHLPVDPVAIEV